MSTPHVVVIGSGLAGLTAAHRLMAGGARVTLVTKGLGGLQLSQGTIDVLGYAPGRVERPLESLASLPAEHPYRTIGAEAVATALGYLTDVVGDDLLAGEAAQNVWLPTAVGAVRPTALAQPSMLGGQCVRGARFVIVGPKQLKDFHPALIAGNLARTDLPDGGRLDARPASFDLPGRDHEVDSSGLTYARALDDPAFRARFAAAVKPLVEPGESVGLPGILGLKDRNAWRALQDLIGHPIFEIPLPPPSVPGMRLNETLTNGLKAARARFILGSKVVGFAADGDVLRSVTLGEAGRQVVIAADAFVLAAGGFESGALDMDSYGVVTDTIFGLPLVGLDAPLIHGDYWGAAQPVFAAGVAVDSSMRVLDGDRVVYANLRAAGGVLAGAQRWQELSGDGIAAASAVIAADSILGGRA